MKCKTCECELLLEAALSSFTLCDAIGVPSGGSKNFERGTEDNLSALSSFIANAHNKIFAFYTEKAAF